MSKLMSRFLTLFTGLLLLALVMPVSRVGSANSPQKPAVAANVARNAAIVAATNEVLNETSEIRELSILRPVKSGAQSRADIERMLIKNLEEQLTPAQMHSNEVSLKKFGLAPPDFQYRNFMIKLLTEQVAGYYDPKAREFHLADWLELEGQKPVMAHELTHALQDQHFNLRRFQNWPEGDSDAEMAAHALVEGDATLAMTIYLAKNPLVALAFSRSLTNGVSTEQYDQAPRSMRESLIFPYLQGSEWATKLYKRGGWAMVSGAFAKLPLSTEQIMHAEKYFSYEPPVKIDLPDLTSILDGSVSGLSKQPTVDSKQQTFHTQQSAVRRRGVQRTAHRSLPTSSWHRIYSDVNGEWSYYLILDQFLNSVTESKRAAAGWAGDRYALYEGPDNQVLLVQVTAWDTENDAREFFAAYAKRTELRYPGAEQSTDLGAALNTNPETRSSYSWKTSEGDVRVELYGSRVVILEGIPGGPDVDKLLHALR